MKFFQDYIGQPYAVSYCSQVCEAISQKRRIPLQPVSFLGHAGLGKTRFANILREELQRASGNEFSFLELSNSVSMPVFLTQWIDKIEGKRAVIFVDEAHNLKNKKVIDLLKRLMETEREVRTVRHEDYLLTANPFDHLYIFATNEEGTDSALFGPTSRTKAIKFVPYSEGEVIAMMQQKADKWRLKIEAPALEYLATRVLPNGRAISELVENECLLVGQKINLESAKKLVKTYGRFPGGLRREDITTLLFLGSDEKGRQVNEIAAACDGEDTRTASYRLQWLAGMGFVLTHSGKKLLTPKGKSYLKSVEEMQKSAKKTVKK